MASSVNAAFCAIVACAFWPLLGYALARHLFPRALAVGSAPILGWAVYNAATLPIFMQVGFSPTVVTTTALIVAIMSGASIFTFYRKTGSEHGATIPAWAYVAAAVLALVPAAAIAPKFAADAMQLADPIFDHSKVAMIDAMTRLGLPPVNPIFGEIGGPDRLAYYYLYYFSAAQLALSLKVSGWEADIAMTWYSAFASLSLTMGLAVWLSQRSFAAIWVVILACGTSLRATLALAFGNIDPLLASSTGFSGWLFQAAWVPQHLASASCVVVAMLLLSQYAYLPSGALLATLTLVAVAGFESSTYVGGVTFAIAALAVVPILLFKIDRAQRLRFVLGLAAAAVLAIALAAPFLLDQFATVGARGVGAPVVIHHFEVLGEHVPLSFRRMLDLPAYWLVLLPIEFPAIYFAGAIALAIMLCNFKTGPERYALAALALATTAGLAISWLLVSTLGDNNDLGLRAVLPAAMILMAGAAAGMMLQRWRAVIVTIAIAGLVLSVPDLTHTIWYNFAGNSTPAGQVFAQTPELWAAVRRHAPPDARVGNNPLFLNAMTPWPVNISWALLANRNSCFAGLELAIAYAPLTRERREAINTQFIRVFDGQGTPEDIDEMATKYGCDVVVVTAQDKAWDNEPFASNPNYRLVEERKDQWRIYTLAPGVKR